MTIEVIKSAFGMAYERRFEMTFPYTQNTGNLTSLISQIGKNGVPDKLTTKDLPVWGFKSSNDRSILSVLRFIGFLDSSGAPTDLWREARTKPDVAVGKGVREGYKSLFQTFPDAERKDSEALTNFFKAKTDVGDAAIRMMVGTFKALAQYGDYSSKPSVAAAPAPSANSDTDMPVQSPLIATALPTSNAGVSVNLNIELALPADETGKVYDAFFKAMKKHLLDGS
ncbi:MAG: hypothetical protein ACJA1G_001232 [Qipengyuania sp.]